MKGAAAALTLPAVSALAACSDAKAGTAPASPPAKPAATPAAPVLTAREQADAMDAMHEKGIKAFPAKTEGQGQPAPRAADRERASRCSTSPASEIEWEVEPGPHGEGVGLQRAGARPADPGARGRPGARQAHQQAPAVHRHPLPRARAAQRSGRRALHHPAAGQAGRELHLRVHRAERGLAHVPLAPQRREAGAATGLLGAFIVEPKRPLARADRRTWTT